MRKRIKPKQEALEWIKKDKDPEGFMVENYGLKGRGVKTILQRAKGNFLLHYAGETISATKGEEREEEQSTGFRFFFRDHKGHNLCVDASEETGRLGRLVNHGNKKEINAVMKSVEGYLVLFAIRDIHPGEELLYDYGLDDLPWIKKSPKQAMEQYFKHTKSSIVSSPTARSSGAALNEDKTGVIAGNGDKACRVAGNVDKSLKGNKAENCNKVGSTEVFWNAHKTLKGDEAWNLAGNGDKSRKGNKDNSLVENGDKAGEEDKAWSLPRNGDKSRKGNEENSLVENGDKAGEEDKAWSLPRNGDKSRKGNEENSLVENGDKAGEEDKAWSLPRNGDKSRKGNEENSLVENGDKAGEKDKAWSLPRNGDKSRKGNEENSLVENGDKAGEEDKAWSLTRNSDKAWNRNIARSLTGNGDEGWNRDEVGSDEDRKGDKAGGITENSDKTGNCDGKNNKSRGLSGNDNKTSNGDEAWSLARNGDKGGSSDVAENGVKAWNSNEAASISGNGDGGGNKDEASSDEDCNDSKAWAIAWNSDKAGSIAGNFNEAGKDNEDWCIVENDDIAGRNNKARSLSGNDNKTSDGNEAWSLAGDGDKDGSSDVAWNVNQAGNNNKAASISGNGDGNRNEAISDLDWNGNKAGGIAWNSDKAGSIAGNFNEAEKDNEDCCIVENGDKAGKNNKARSLSGNDNKTSNGDVALSLAGNGDKGGSSDVAENGNKAGNSNEAVSISGNGDEGGDRDEASSDVDLNDDKAGGIVSISDKAGSIAGNFDEAGIGNEDWCIVENGDEGGKNNKARSLSGNDNKTSNGDEAWSLAGNGDKCGCSDEAGNVNKAWNSNEAASISGNGDGGGNRDEAGSDVDWNDNKAGGIALNSDKAWSIAGNFDEAGKDNEDLFIVENGDKAGKNSKGRSLSGNDNETSNLNEASSLTEYGDKGGSNDVAGNGNKAGNRDEAGSISGNYDNRNMDEGSSGVDWNGDKAGSVAGNGNKAGKGDETRSISRDGEIAGNKDKANSDVYGNVDKTWSIAVNGNKAGSIAGYGDIDGNGDEAAVDIEAWSLAGSGDLAGNGDKALKCDETKNDEKAGSGDIPCSIAGLEWQQSSEPSNKVAGTGNEDWKGYEARNGDITGKLDKACNVEVEVGIVVRTGNDYEAWNGNKAGNVNKAAVEKKASSIADYGDKALKVDETGNCEKSGSGVKTWSISGNDNKAWNGDLTGNFDQVEIIAWNGYQAGSVVWNDSKAGFSEIAGNGNEARYGKKAWNRDNSGSIGEQGNKALSEVAGNFEEAVNGDKVGNINKAGNGNDTWNVDEAGNEDKAGNGEKAGNTNEEAWKGNKTLNGNETWNGDEGGNTNKEAWNTEEESGNGNEAWNGNKTWNGDEAGNDVDALNSNIVLNHDIALNGDQDGNENTDIVSETDESDESEVLPVLSVTDERIWGSVIVLQQGRRIGTFQMHSTVLGIGSSRSNDIIVKNATPHEVILEVNCHGEVFAVRGHEVKVLHHKECFYVGGRQFKWCYPVRKENTDIVSETDESDESEVLPVLSVTERKEAVHLLKKYERLKKKYKQLKRAGADTTEPMELKRSCSTTDVERRSSNDKKLACVFCGKLLVHRITEHWTHEHSDELEVAKIHASTGAKKKILTQKLRNRGNFKHNIKVLQGGGDRFIPVKQCKSAKLEDYLPCTSCYGFYQGKELWRHHRNCPLNTCQQGSSESANVQAEARLMLRAAVLPDSIQSEDEKILEMLKTRKDDIGKQIEGDSLILKMTKVLWNKLGSRRKNDISQRARQLARLKLEINRQKKEQCELIDFLCGKKYDCVIEAVHNLAGLHENEENVKRFEKPGLALRIGHNLVKACEIKIGMCLRNDYEVGLKEGETFLKLLKAEWKDSVSSVALATLKTNKFNKGEVLPLTEDLKTLKIYLDNRIQDLTSQFESQSYETWRELAEVTLARILIFNKRRSAEASKLLLSAYNERPNWREKANQEIFDSLTELEQNMFDRMDMIETQGKMDKKVPTLLTSHMVHAIDTLNEYRSSCGIKATNKYIFANQENGHLDSWQVLNKVAVKAGCKKPELINSVSLRKYIATVSQILDLNEGEVHWLSSHLAHTVKTHKDFYRLQSAAVEIGKVSKLLLLTENGDVSKFKGKSLEEIQIDDSIAFDKGDIEEDNGLYDIAEEDSLDEEITQDEHSETNLLSHGGSKECPGKGPHPHELNLDDEHSETNSLSQRGGKKRQRKSQRQHVGIVKRQRKGPHPLKLNLSDSDSDDSVRDPTFMDNDSSSDDEQPPPNIQTKHYKQRWSLDEIQTFNRVFSTCLKEKLMPTAAVLKIAAKQLPKRTIAQIRTRVNNVIKGKQSS